MPLKSRYNKSRFRRTRKMPTGGKRVNKIQTKAIVNIQKKIKSIVRSEPKYVGLTISESTLVNGTPKSHLLNGIAQGDTNLFRDGSKVRWKYLELRGYCKSTTALTGHTLMRFVLVVHKDTNGVAMSTKLDDLFMKAETDDATPDALSMYNYIKGDWKNHFKVLWDSGALIMGPNRIDYTSATGHTSVHPHERVFHIRKRLNMQTVYGLGDAGGVADIATNAVHLIAFSDTTTASALNYDFESLMVATEV